MPIHIYFTIQDGKGETSTVTIPFPDGTPLTDIPHLVQAFADLLDPLTTGGLLQAGARIIQDATGWIGTPSASADVQEKAEFILRTANGFLKRLNLPTFLESLFTPGSAVVDTADADVAAFVTALEDGVDLTGVGGSGVVQPCDLRGEDLVSLERAIENWGRRRG